MDPIWAAFWDVEKGMPVKQAARIHGVNYSTLWKLRKNPVPRKIGGQTAFTSYDEFMLASLVRCHQVCTQPLSLDRTKDIFKKHADFRGKCNWLSRTIRCFKA